MLGSLNYIYSERAQRVGGGQAPAKGTHDQNGARKFHGKVADGYDEKREDSPKWRIEQAIITGMLDDLPPGSVILDAPVGTGRFLEFYAKKGFRVYGVDRSGDMLKQAYQKGMRVNLDGDLVEGDVRDTKLPDGFADATVNCRITRWLSPEDCQKMFREMQRVTKQRIIFTARVANHTHARAIELFEEALEPGWKITRNEAGYVTDYRIIMAERT